MNWTEILRWVYAAGAIAACLYWWISLALAIRVVRSVGRLRDVALPGEQARLPKISLIIPACNEAETIEAALRGRLREDYPNVEFVVINDRSSDATGAIVDRVAGEDARVKPVHIRELPAGWLGKVHAMHVGAQRAAGEWLLLTDADVHFEPGTLRRAVAHCERRGAQFLSVLPDMWPSGWLLDATISAFMRFGVLGARAWAVENPRSRAAVGVGAFNFVHREALARTPGFEWIRLEVIDDGGLARMIKQGGAGCTILGGQGMVGLHWYRSAGEMIRGAEKNAFSGLGQYRLGRLVFFVLLHLLLEFSPLLALLPLLWPALSPAGLPLGALTVPVLGMTTMAAVLATVVVLARWLERSVISGILSPLGTVIFAFAAIRSGVLAVRRGGIYWRDTFYRLSELRQGIRFTFP